MKTIRLYGEMGRKFGREFRMAVGTPAEAIRALCAVVPGFRAYLYSHRADHFRVLVGLEAQDEDGLRAPVGESEVIRFVPVVAGAKDGFGRIVLGAVLIVAAIWSGGATSGLLYSMGTSMVLSGVAELLAGTQASIGAAVSGNNEMETWTFGAPTLTTGQGGCVPLLLGTMRIGGHLISAGIDAQTWQEYGFGGAAPDNDGTIGGDGDTSPWCAAIAP